MPDTTNEPEPVIEAVEVYANDIYKITYTDNVIGFDEVQEEPELMCSNHVRFYEITDHNTVGEIWSNPSVLNEININNCCCSRAFTDHIKKEVENNKTQFPTQIKFNSDEFWLIYNIKKIN